MNDHGFIDDDEGARVLGAFVQRMVDQLGFCADGAVAVSSFEVDDVLYEVRLSKGQPA